MIPEIIDSFQFILRISLFLSAFPSNFSIAKKASGFLNFTFVFIFGLLF